MAYPGRAVWRIGKPPMAKPRGAKPRRWTKAERDQRDAWVREARQK